MNKLILLSVLILLSACSVRSAEFEEAERLCSTHEGVESVKRFINRVTVHCEDGMNYTFYAKDLKS